ncbi:GNAT family N-acetyltransferase, partial [Candidatus Parvarchaeota archaeon]|nr:GNAT family N-acetyltransferase [Candidatus Parvarchaeota archaeon]
QVRQIAQALFKSPRISSGPSNIYFVAKQAGKIIGFSHLVMQGGTGASQTVLQGLGVAKKYQGRGVGTLLVEASIAHCKRLGVQSILLKVKAFNPALSLYLKEGFVQSFVEKNIVMKYRQPN